MISKSCALPEVRNVIDCVKKCSRFFLNSPKRSGVLEMFINPNEVNAERRKPLIDLRKTQWAERHSAYQHFYQRYVFVVEALEMIAFRYHLLKYRATYADWDYAVRNEAQQILTSVTSFQFAVVFVTIYRYLSHLPGITVKLQSKAVDIVEAHNMISEIVRTYNSKRANVESSFSQIYKVSSDMAKRLAVQLQCLALQQGNKIAAIFQRLLFKSISREMLQFPFLIILLLASTASSQSRQSQPFGLVPSIICSQDVNLEEALIKYRDDLPSPELMDSELRR